MPSYKKIVAPSKTYFVGEYSVLKGGPSLLLATKPCFELRISEGVSPSIFHPSSPAGQYWARFAPELSRYQLEFLDPHQGQGGFGASSAQLLTLMALRDSALLNPKTNEKGFSVLQEYLQIARASGAPISGGDLMAQWAGKMTYYQREPFALEAYSWPFHELGFALIRTGFKVPTHEHVQSLKTFAIDEAQALVLSALSAITQARSRELIDAVLSYRQWLRQMSFEASHTTELLSLIESTGLTRAAKGCGAMGADVVLVLFNKENQERFLSWAQRQKLMIVATAEDLCNGLSEASL